jgi:hypothetical protein
MTFVNKDRIFQHEQKSHLQQDSFQGHDLLPGVDPESLELSVVGQLSHRPNDVATFLRSFFGFARQKQAAGSNGLK